MRKKIKGLQRALSEAQGSVGAARSALAQKTTTAGKAKAAERLEEALRAEFSAAAALAAAQATEPAAPPSAAEVEEEEEASAEVEEEEEDDEEDNEPAEAVTNASTPGRRPRAAASQYTPEGLLKLAQRVTGQTSIRGVFGALEGFGERLAALNETETRVAALERDSRSAKVDALIATAKADGRVIGKAHAEDLRAQGIEHGTKWLKGRMAVMPKLARTEQDGELAPRTDGNGNPLGGMSAEQQKIFQQATAGLNKEQLAKFTASFEENLRKGSASKTPSH